MALSVAKGPARPRRWPRRLLVGISVLVALGLLGGIAGYGYFHWQFGRIQKVNLPLAKNRADTTGALQPDIEGEPMTVLLVGSDSRTNLKGADCQRNCRDETGELVTGQRSDTIMLLHAEPRTNRAAILSIPRDLWVPIAGAHRSNRINSAFENGPQQLIQTINQTLGISINHFLGVDFVGFRNLVNALGGVPIYVPAPARDIYSDLHISNPGCITFNGDQALAWVRSRHFEYYESGRWRTDQRSDFGRIARQQDFIRRVMRKSISEGIRNPVILNRLVGIAVENVTIDSEMTSKDIVQLAQRFRSLDPESVSMYTLPVTETVIGGADVLKMKQPEAQQIIDEFNGRPVGGNREQPPPGVLPDSVRVRTLNGSGENELAGRVANQLQSFGFQNVGVGDADRFSYAKTVVKYGRGQRGKAALVQSYLVSGGELQEDSDLTVDVVLVLGGDFDGVARPGAKGSTSRTTASGTATSAPSVPSAPTTTAPESPVPIPRGAPPQPQC